MASSTPARDTDESLLPVSAKPAEERVGDAERVVRRRYQAGGERQPLHLHMVWQNQLPSEVWLFPLNS